MMDKQPLTSVVIPAYNAEIFLERTLRSALGQTYSNIEVIVVNDGSTDKTRGIAEAVASANDRIRIISVPNGGVAKARNIGIAEANGEYVAFLDADDLWHPTKIERQVAAMSSDGDYEPAAVYAFSRSIDTNDRVMGSGVRVVLGGYSFARHLYARPVGNGSSILVSRKAALAVGGFDPTWAARGIGGCEDLDFELRIAAKYPITAVGQHLVGYREYPGNMSSNSKAMALGAISTVAHHIELCPELPGWVARSSLASISEYAVAKLLGAGHRKLLLRELVRLLRIDFGRGLKFASMISMRKLSSLMSMTTPAQTGDSSDRPFFYDVSPDFIDRSSSSDGQPRKDKMLRRLETVDIVLARNVAQPRL
jgi:glycosyltransferase involved in cell wall biosynthesis